MSILRDMSRQRLTKYDQAVPMYQSGLSIQEIANFFQVTRQSMWAALKRRRVEFRTNTRSGMENHFHRGTWNRRGYHHLIKIDEDLELFFENLRRIGNRIFRFHRSIGPDFQCESIVVGSLTNTSLAHNVIHFGNG